ncbi:hypothetical protein FPV67DRAFT_1674208 [Lyophyllum atratum]|nr:hypothetical protein FPV67DRAFT_1674208 [Lyophyllum atratum]
MHLELFERLIPSPSQPSAGPSSYSVDYLLILITKRRMGRAKIGFLGLPDISYASLSLLCVLAQTNPGSTPQGKFPPSGQNDYDYSSGSTNLTTDTNRDHVILTQPPQARMQRLRNIVSRGNGGAEGKSLQSFPLPVNDNGDGFLVFQRKLPLLPSPGSLLQQNNDNLTPPDETREPDDGPRNPRIQELVSELQRELAATDIRERHMSLGVLLIQESARQSGGIKDDVESDNHSLALSTLPPPYETDILPSRLVANTKEC